MTGHYYSHRPDTPHDRQYWKAELRGHTLQFVSDAGVFSKGGVDFGSRVLIENMDIPDGAQVLDVGCGYGPIGMAAAKLAPQGHVTMVDVNERALELARENAKRNGITNVTVLKSDGLDGIGSSTFDVILTNPPIRAGKEVVHRIFEQSHGHLNARGALWIVIQKKQGAPSAEAKLRELFGEEQVELAAKEKGYRIYRAVKE
ncbi:class I SAM-dependent methyltransferase [Paenibacillus melissococcoides]|uniref:Class I SAM-dependent methyltransferase n=1 Tax=Paenibacillus melissococcoides TaxID=2912268 RepID=A0ABM9GCA9_9BACL|nr:MULTISPECIES: class I SAM-dependent methyltransferase [Paenibacillus]MEB9894217.1 class I SAM-dependent methyltransferase [Bacillus cereus]GIO79441.1 methyltransferase [Paenibacillus dendritiformis]CAH8249797.1 class I SAM-dependent methyltransferase [Paenibacillus melissococcoides]CAH8721717.1 class I SAM-dependent methyltransferase [Paenibacillus melissococcoides]